MSWLFCFLRWYGGGLGCKRTFLDGRGRRIVIAFNLVLRYTKEKGERWRQMKITRKLERKLRVLWEEAGIANDFIFGKIMQNPEFCRPMLERILHIKIARLEYTERQKDIKITGDGKGIRLDVYVEDQAHTVYNVEIQTYNSGELPKRSRYYQALIDLNLIERGMSYSSLRKSFVIFICTFDLFDLGRHIYTFENRCAEELFLALKDEAVKIFLNAAGTADDVTPELEAFLDYIAGQKPEDDFVQRLDEEVRRIKTNEKWRLEFMVWQAHEMELRERSLAEGIKIGEKRGEKRGEIRGEQRGRLIGEKKGIQKTREEMVCRALEKEKDLQRAAELLNIFGFTYDEIKKIADKCGCLREKGEGRSEGTEKG